VCKAGAYPREQCDQKIEQNFAKIWKVSQNTKISSLKAQNINIKLLLKTFEQAMG
jgi:hypothetical protein